MLRVTSWLLEGSEAGELRVVNQSLIPQPDELGVTLLVSVSWRSSAASTAPLNSSRRAWTSSFRSASLVSALIFSFSVVSGPSIFVSFRSASSSLTLRIAPIPTTQSALLSSTLLAFRQV